MTPITLDFETYYDSQYSLKKMPTVLYVRDPRFRILGAGVKIDSAPTLWYPEQEVTAGLQQIDWSDALLIGHNLLFDGLVLYEKFGIQPKRYCDTQGLANAFLPVGFKRGLNDVAELLGLGTKLEGLEQLKGVSNPTDEQLKWLETYCVQDVDLTYEIYKLMYPLMPLREKEILHVTTRMGCVPQIVLDQKILAQEIAEEKEKRETLKDQEKQLASNPQFAALLKNLTGECPMKLSNKGEMIPALGKNDAEYVKFKIKHPDLSALFRSREEIKSTIKLRRAEKYLQIAKTGTMPMPYRYYGAHTGRFSGSDSLNVQNIPNLHRSNMRLAFTAPQGMVIHVRDSSQIELRIQLWFSGDTELLNKLAKGDDVYSELASKIYGKTITKKDKLERGVGKATELGGQYGMGAKRYQAYLAGGPLGLAPIFLTEEEAENAIAAYRQSHKYTVNMWRTLDAKIGLMKLKDDDKLTSHKERRLGPVRFMYERVTLPNGMYLDYSGLEATEENGWTYGLNKETKFLWGGTLLENITQALARIIVTNQALEIEKFMPVVGWTHDENLMLGPIETADADHERIAEIMKRPPLWAPDLPLDSEGGWSVRYEK